MTYTHTGPITRRVMSLLAALFVHFRKDTKRVSVIKAGATQTETSLLKQYVAGERVDLLDDTRKRG